MAITYPLSLPSGLFPNRARVTPRSIVGVSASPFTGQQQVYAHQGQWWELDLSFGPLSREKGERLAAFLLSLNGRQGTFVLAPPGADTPRGTAASATVSGGSQTGSTLTVTGSGTLKAGDWLQLGSGSTARLHRNLADASLGLGTTLDIWPRLRSSPTNGATVTIVGAVGLWRLASNDVAHDLVPPFTYSIAIPCVEAL